MSTIPTPKRNVTIPGSPTQLSMLDSTTAPMPRPTNKQNNSRKRAQAIMRLQQSVWRSLSLRISDSLRSTTTTWTLLGGVEELGACGLLLP